jgi:hypothetical protein
VNKADTGVRRKHAEITRKRKLGAATERIAVERRYYRHRETAHGLERCFAFFGHRGRFIEAAHSAKVSQVTAGGEALVTGASQYRHQHGGIICASLENLVQLSEHGTTQGVAFFRTVDGNVQHASFNLRPQVSTNHPTFLI